MKRSSRNKTETNGATPAARPSLPSVSDAREWLTLDHGPRLQVALSSNPRSGTNRLSHIDTTTILYRIARLASPYTAYGRDFFKNVLYATYPEAFYRYISAKWDTRAYTIKPAHWSKNSLVKRIERLTQGSTNLINLA